MTDRTTNANPSPSSETILYPTFTPLPRSRTPLADAVTVESIAGAIARVLRERDIPLTVFERWLGAQMDEYTGDDHG